MFYLPEQVYERDDVLVEMCLVSSAFGDHIMYSIMNVLPFQDRLFYLRAYHGHSKPLMGLSSYKMKEKEDTGIAANPHAWIVSHCSYSTHTTALHTTDLVIHHTQYAMQWGRDSICSFRVDCG